MIRELEYFFVLISLWERREMVVGKETMSDMLRALAKRDVCGASGRGSETRSECFL